MTYLLISKKQTIALYASSGVNVKEHHWYVDNKFIARRKQNEKIFFGLNDGQHTITCVDDKGRSSSVSIKVKHL
jgi:membrane carboxypeptidase/penicillin-binding protein PbpC